MSQQNRIKRLFLLFTSVLNHERNKRVFVILFSIFAGWSETVSIARAQFPKVEEADWPSVRRQTERLLKQMPKENAPLTPRECAAVRDLLGAMDEQVLAKLQGLLDPHCLIAVHVNPESRVKVRRGPARADLTLNRRKWFLVKVHNEAGIREALKVSGNELLPAGKKPGDGRWLEVRIVHPTVSPQALTGNKLEHVLIGLTAREAGKREATLKLDAGQGTQDLGFRAEAPILFRVRAIPK